MTDFSHIKVFPPLFSLDDAQAAADDWNFNCGPGALCAILGKSPSEIRPQLLDFEAKGYTSPSMMAAILKGMGVPFKRVFEAPAACTRDALPEPVFPAYGLVRIQWDGSWCNEGVPIPARYRKTHWIGYQAKTPMGEPGAFDINAMSLGGWVTFKSWQEKLAPWLIGECVKGGNGQFWPTHCWEIDRRYWRA